ncbi:hypothetical protein [Hafnia alvei]|uniref:hypothetical protein n=1 Tax=Hafnia alvei TaxID=569 RepID=UPI00061CE5BC|nr:hypothetical protein [Hafnia alvei]KKF38751.1 hypothetical protein PU01_21415 [Hafnia alvei]MBW3475179.1 hypothetical protein [Hafnia alvei]
MKIKSFFRKVPSCLSNFFLSPQRKIIFIAVIISMICIFLPRKGNPSTTDWISSISDIVVAFAAIMGLYMAQQWKREATQSKAIEHCINIMTRLIPKSKEQFVPSIYEKIGIIMLVDLEQCDCVDVKRIRALRNLMEKYYHSQKDKESTLLALQSEFKNITALSWRVKNKFKFNIDELIDTLFNIRVKEVELITNISIIMSRWNVKFGCDDETKHYDITFKLKNSINLTDAKNLCIEITRLKEDLNSVIEKMAIEKKSIFEIFESQI